VKRGEVWWADLQAPAGRRPVLLLNRDAAYQVRNTVIVALVTTRVRRIPTEVPLGVDEGMPKACVINLDNLQAIPRASLGTHITTLTPAKVEAVDQAVHFALGLRT
jgi:mRNA interferase MazF